MNQLFQFRLSLILGLLLLLAINNIWPIWPQVSLWLSVFCCLYLLLTVVSQWWQPQWHQNPMMIVVDLLLWSVFFACLQGVSNPLIWCLLIPTVLASLSQSTSFTWLVTLASNLVYLWLWYLGVHDVSDQHHGSMMANHITGMWLGFIFVSFLLSWATTRLMYRIKVKNLALLKFEQQRQADENLLKMATLATSLAHELGTPLASIHLLVNELKHEVVDGATDKDLNLLESQVLRCKNVLAELTTVADKSRPDQARKADVADYIEQLLTASAGELNYVIDITFQQQLAIMVDDLFKLACLNVLNNSAKSGADQLIITLSKDHDQAVIQFKDQMTAGEKSQADQSGLGIGLKLSQRIIESMGGQLSFAALSTGAETTIRMPVYE